MNNQSKLDNKFVSITLSILLAIVLWFIVVNEFNPEITKNLEVPIKIINEEYLISNNLMLLSNKDDLKFVVSLKGRKEDLEKATVDNIYGTIDLAGISKKGKERLKINLPDIPDRVTLVNTSKTSIEVEIDKRITKSLAVEQLFKGTPKEGVAPIVNSINPMAISVSGPETLIKKAFKGIVYVDLDEIVADDSYVLPVVVVDSTNTEIKGINIEPLNVSVNVTLGTVKEVNLNLTLKGKLDKGLHLKSTKVYPEKIKIVGKGGLFDTITSINSKPVDLSEIQTSTYLNLEMDLPEGIKQYDMNQVPKAYFEIEGAMTKEVKVESSVLNLDSGLKVNGEIQPISITIKGSYSLINAPDSIRLYADLKGLKAGTHSVKLRVETKEGVTIVGSYNDLITVELVPKG